MGALDRLRGFFTTGDTPTEARDGAPLSMSEWQQMFSFNGIGYGSMPSFSLRQSPEEIERSFTGYVEGIYKKNGVVFACMATRQLLFSEARFQYRNRINGRPGELYGSPALRRLETPWPNGTTGDLLTRAIQDVDVGGNFFAAAIGSRIYRLQPDWMTIVTGSRSGIRKPNGEPDPNAPDIEVLGYVYQPGGPRGDGDPTFYLPESICHWAPYPDPTRRFLGMSWLTPVLREITSDSATTTHKQKFFENGATPNMVVSMDPEIDEETFNRFIELFRTEHEGVANAYKTLFLGGGANVEVVGKDMQQIDFKAVQGHGETRIAAAAGVPPVIVGLSEGLEAATYSNYAQARRRFADGTMRPLWRGIAASLASIVPVPPNAELWYDDRDIPFLQEDVKDRAEILSTDASTSVQLINGGYEPDAVIQAVTAGDLRRLLGKHTGLLSVQLQQPGSGDLEKPGDKPVDAESDAEDDDSPTPQLPPGNSSASAAPRRDQAALAADAIMRASASDEEDSHGNV